MTGRMPGSGDFDMPHVRQLQQMDDWSKQMEQQRAEMMQSIAEASEAKDLELKAKVERELRSLELAEGLLEQQRLMVQEQQALTMQQRRQARAGVTDRRIQYAILTATVLALAISSAGVVFSASKSAGFAFAVCALVVVTLGAPAVLAIWRGLRKEQAGIAVDD